MFGRIKSLFRRTPKDFSQFHRAQWPAETAARRVRASYDIAQTTDENRNHWAAADSLSADASLLYGVRQIVRRRARYEVANNSYAKGMIETLAGDVIGTGPRLQLLGDDPNANAFVEREFCDWLCEIRAGEKLRTMKKSKTVDGDAIAVKFTNPRAASPVKLDIHVIEADQLGTPFQNVLDPTVVDGIKFNSMNNPVEYYILPYHPGSINVGVVQIGKVTTVPADQVFHWFRVDRPGQTRGLSEIAAALPLFAQLRRFILATVRAAETSASFAAVMKTSGGAGDDIESSTELPEVEIQHRMMVPLPAGWDISQLKAEHPATTCEMFVRLLLQEIARCLSMPYNVAAGNSSSYNYASGRMDHQVYYKTIRCEQMHAAHVILNPLFNSWFAEARLIDNYLPAVMRKQGIVLPRQWFWDGAEHVDPEKEATAAQTRLISRTTTYAAEFARAGKDWEAEFRQIARERTLAAELGIDLPMQQLGGSPQSHPAGMPEEDMANED